MTRHQHHRNQLPVDVDVDVDEGLLPTAAPLDEDGVVAPRSLPVK